MCRQNKARAFTGSAKKQGPNSTNSLRTIRAFFKKKKKSACGRYFFGTSQCVEAVRRRTASHGFTEGQNLPTTVCPTSLAPYLSSSRPQAIEDQFHNKSREQSVLIPLLHALQSFVQCHNWAFEVLFPQFQHAFYAVVLALWVIKTLSTISCRVHPRKCPRFLTSIWQHANQRLPRVVSTCPPRCDQ